MTKLYSIHNLFHFNISGANDLFNYLTYQFRYFERQNQIGASHLKIIIDRIPAGTAEKELRNGEISYCLKDGLFFLSANGESVLFDGNLPLKEQNKVIFSRNYPQMNANLICDMIFRLNLLDQKIVLIHASCVAKGKRAVLIPAWKSTGKTTLSLKLVKNGLSFLGDDKVWLNEEGKVYSYPRYLVIKDSNAKDLKEFIGRQTVSGYGIYKFISSIKLLKKTGRTLSILKKMLGAKPRHYYIEELIPESKIMDEASISGFFYMAKAMGIFKADIESTCPEIIINNIVNIDNSEWNYDLLRLAAAHDILFSNGPVWTEEIMKMMRLERQIISSAVRKSHCFRIDIPALKTGVSWDSVTTEIANRILEE